MKMAALNCLEDLRGELEGMEETEAEFKNISGHVSALECILKGAKKSVCSIFLA